MLTHAAQHDKKAHAHEEDNKVTYIVLEGLKWQTQKGMYPCSTSGVSAKMGVHKKGVC